MSAHPTTTSAVAAEAVVNLDGTGTWSIGGATEPISASTPKGACDEVAHRTVVAAAEQGTAIDVTVTLAGVPTLLQVSPTGEITGFEVSGIALAPASSPELDPSSESGAIQGSRRLRPRWTIAAAVSVLAAAAVAVTGVVIARGTDGISPSPSMALATRAAASTPAASRSTTHGASAAARRKLDVLVTAPKGGPLTARVRATAAPTVATLTVWRAGQSIATRRVHLTSARAHWSSGTVTFTHLGPGSYRWAATAPGAARVTGRYRVPVEPAPHGHGAPPAVTLTPPPSQVPASSAPASPPPATAPPPATTPQASPPQSPPPQSSPPQSPAPTRQPTQHNGPVPGGNTNPPHTGPRP